MIYELNKDQLKRAKDIVKELEEKHKLWLIEKTNWKGKSLGNVKVSDKHALILTNPNGLGNFSDIKKLADKIIDDVYKKFNIELEPEVQYINI